MTSIQFEFQPETTMSYSKYNNEKEEQNKTERRKQ